MFVESYLYFDGRCEEAMNFYGTAIGAEKEFVMRFKECPDPQGRANSPPGSEEKIMHASMMIRDTRVMVSDGNCKSQAKYEGFGLALSAKDNADAEKLFAALSEGGQPFMPMTETFFAHRFGMVKDKFGIMWLVMHGKGHPN